MRLMRMRLCRLGLRRLGARLRLRRGQERGKRWLRFGIRSGGPGRRWGVSWNEMAEVSGCGGRGEGSVKRERETERERERVWGKLP